jgi:uncharacterized protein
MPSGKPDAPRIAIVITGLGVSSSVTQAAMTKLPGAVTFAFGPYGFEIDRTVGKARSDGHEVLLQVPMEPFDYPDNDPGPQTLLVSLSADQNLDRLHWLMSRFQGDDGSSHRSLAGQIASANNLQFAKAEVVLDATPTPANIDRALARLEALAKERGTAVGVASALPASIDRIANWVKAAESRGVVLVPITAVASKPSSS